VVGAGTVLVEEAARRPVRARAHRLVTDALPGAAQLRPEGVMGYQWPSRSTLGGRYRGHSNSHLSTLLALLLAVSVPALMVALAAGWRPVDAEQATALVQWWDRLTGRTPPPSPVTPTSWALPDGHFFALRAGQPADGQARGYAVTDAAGLPFWSEYQGLGGPHFLGYPRSNRYAGEDGATVQVFQRAALRAESPEAGITVVPLLDWLHQEGYDETLAAEHGIPALELPLPAEVAAETFEERVQWVLRDYPALQAYVASLPDALKLLGVPTSPVHDLGAYYAVRFQGGVLQEWKEEMPWANPGDVTAVNAGDIALTVGLIPGEVAAPTTATPPAAPESAS
jgi:hypothetical protein